MPPTSIPFTLQGHLLHVSPDFGRYVATAYTARDVLDLVVRVLEGKRALLAWCCRACGRGERASGRRSLSPRDAVHAAGSIAPALPCATPLQQLCKKRVALDNGALSSADAGPSLSSPDSEPHGDQPTSSEDIGRPLFELFVRHASTGGLESQAAALFAMEDEEGRARDEDQGRTPDLVQTVAESPDDGTVVDVVADSSDGDSSPEDVLIRSLASAIPGSVVSVERGTTDDGGHFIRINLKPPGADADADGEGGGLEALVDAALAGQLDAAEGELPDEQQQAGNDSDDDDGIRTIDELARLVRLDVDDAEDGTPDSGGAVAAAAGDPAANGAVDSAYANSSSSNGSLHDAVARLQAQQDSFSADLAALKSALSSGAFSEQEQRDVEEAIADVQQQVADGHAAAAARAAGRAARAAASGPAATGTGADGDGDDLSGSVSGSTLPRGGSDGASGDDTSTLSAMGCPYYSLQRMPAELEWQGRDAFTLAVLPDNEPVACGGGAGGDAGPSASSSSRVAGERSIEVRLDSLLGGGGALTASLSGSTQEAEGWPPSTACPAGRPCQRTADSPPRLLACSCPPSRRMSPALPTAAPRRRTRRCIRSWSVTLNGSRQAGLRLVRALQPLNSHGAYLSDARLRSICLHRLSCILLCMQADRLSGKPVPPERVREVIAHAMSVLPGKDAPATLRASLAAAGPTSYRRLHLDRIVKT